MFRASSLLKRLKFPRGRRVLSFGRDERGVTAIEFGLLAIPFFALIFAILETAEVFLASQILDAAVGESSRLIRTGQAQNANYTAANFNTAICNNLYGLFDCSKLQVKVSIVSGFASATVTSPLNPADPTQWTLVPTYNPGVGSQVIMVQVYYKWHTLVNFGGFTLASSSDGTHLMGSVRVFENEPFT